MRPLVFDGVGTIVARNLDGTIKYIEDKVTKVNLQLQFDWQAVMGGDSGYAFHYTAGDLQDKVSIEVPRFSPAIADMSQGGETVRKSVEYDETEISFLKTGGYTLIYGNKLIAGSDEVYIVDEDTDELKQLTRVASTPTDEQYTITSEGKIESTEANNTKKIRVMYNWMAEGTETSFKGTRRPTPFKLTHRFELIDDKTGNSIQCQVTIHKALGGGTLDASQERKKPNTTTMDLQVMDPDISPKNPKGHAMSIIFGI
ncbi:hypothetical protein [Paenibacillus amylolyticus]|uniref:Uncharacterized protein n=1 Tax=Paenibacillus amylolyticus TaxID=1451 RepID=A0A100VMD5_PAEAM|nr:hypothetical protein [Paenibacillus amylolyticus]GAS82391.1 unknown protein [Paenibacillus amylolyticus]